MNKDYSNLNLKRLWVRYPIAACYLFGSRATDRATPSSDYDFAVLFSSKVPSNRYADYKLRLIRELLRLVKVEFVDVVILNEPKVPLLLKFNIVKEGQVIYQKNRLQRVQFECDVLLKWYDQKYFEDLWYTLFTKRLAQGKIL